MLDPSTLVAWSRGGVVAMFCIQGINDEELSYA